MTSHLRRDVRIEFNDKTLLNLLRSVQTMDTEEAGYKLLSTMMEVIVSMLLWYSEGFPPMEEKANVY